MAQASAERLLLQRSVSDICIHEPSPTQVIFYDILDCNFRKEGENKKETGAKDLGKQGNHRRAVKASLVIRAFHLSPRARGQQGTWEQ